MKQRDFGPFTLATMGNAWLDAATFERARLKDIQCPTNQTGVSQQVRSLAIDACKADITKYETRAQATFKVAITDEAQTVAESYEFQHIEGAA